MIGCLDEGLPRSREAARFDPLSLAPAHNIGINFLVRGDYEQAAAGFRHAIGIDPNWTWGYVKLARTLAMQKDYKEADAALDWYEKAFANRTPNMVYAAILPRICPVLSGNQRFEAIIDRMGFPSAAKR